MLAQPRVVRFAGFTAMGLIELDFPASHGQQLLKYAVRHQLPCDTLRLAYGGTAAVNAFRRRPELGVSPLQVKRITNLLGYGNNGKEWLLGNRLQCCHHCLQT